MLSICEAFITKVILDHEYAERPAYFLISYEFSAPCGIAGDEALHLFYFGVA